MKKLLLFFTFVLLTLSMPAVAQPKQSSNTIGSRSIINKQKLPECIKAPVATAGEQGFTIQFSNEMYSWYALLAQNQINYRCHIYITPDMATQIAGSRITNVSFSTTTDFETSPRQGSVFVTESLEGTPTTSTTCEVANCMSLYQETGILYQTVTLDEPYTVKAGTGFYIGYEVQRCRFSAGTGSADYPVGIDSYMPNGYSGTVDIYDYKTGEFIRSYDMANDVGTNLFIAAFCEGNVDGFKDLFMLGNMAFDTFTLPVVDATKDQTLHMPVLNAGTNALTQMNYTVTVNGKNPTSTRKLINIPSRQSDYVEIPVTNLEEGYNLVTVTVTRVNTSSVDLSSSATCLGISGEGYPRKMVIEEATGAWCPNCPRGIVGLEYMVKTYGDAIIPIAVHDGDALAVDSYEGFINSYISAFPMCIVNRDPIFLDDPNSEYLDLFYSNYWKNQPGAAQIELNVEPTDNALSVTANTTFAFSEADSHYELAFVILEDDLLELQQNNYTNGQMGELEWWDQQGKEVLWQYKHTARDIFDCFGITGSIPASITKGSPLSYTHQLSLDNVTDLTKTSVVAMVLDGHTGSILNATMVDASVYAPSGIENVINDNNDATPEYFNLQGMSISNPTPGSLVICRKGSTATKMIVK